MACSRVTTTIHPMRGTQRIKVPRGGNVAGLRLPSVKVWLIISWSAMLAGCVAQSVVVIGETPLPPAADIPVVPISVIDDLGEPVSGATVLSDDQRTTTDGQGMATIEWRGQAVSVSVQAGGFFNGAIAVDAYDDDAFELELRPVVLRGTVTDSSGFGLGGATVALATQEAVTDENGRFELSRAELGTITASRPGWHATEQFWDGEALVTEIHLVPRIIRGIHIAASVLADPAEFAALLDVAGDTVVNALVIDVKDEDGWVYYDSGVTLAREVGAVRAWFDIDNVVKEMDDRDLYKIARIVVFEDPVAARALPDMAVIDGDTGVAYVSRGQYFLDPFDPVARKYALDLAAEVCSAGFDEIQFDYVRFPAGWPDSALFDEVPSEENRTAAINGFLEEAGARLHPLGCAVAADVFGFITSIDYDGGIGQRFSMLSNSVDVLSPMIYPSHYTTDWFGYDVPNDHPGGVVGGALDDGVTRIEGPAVVRPWLQDFYYTSDQVREQIDEAESRALGWMLWNVLSNFQWDALAEDDTASDDTSPVSDDTGGDG